MVLFWKYLKEHSGTLAMLALFSVIFAVVFWLYHLPLQAVVYPVLLSALFGILFMMVDFRKTKQKHDILVKIRTLTAAMIADLPPEEKVEDGDYQAIIRSLQSEVSALQTSSDAKYQDMIEYYTLWAHQIKTPIASMRLHLQNEDSAGSRSLQADLFRIEQYVEMVLAFLRLDAVSSDYVFRAYPVDTIIRQAVKKFSHEFIGRKIRLLFEPTDLTLVTDDKWLSFVLEQIISNALKYTREGSIRIYMKAPELLCIEDTGIGIAPEDLPRIFENGYTGYNGRTDKKASGIGLYLCKRICDNLGIGIDVTSKIGVGTAVTLDLHQYKLRRE